MGRYRLNHVLLQFGEFRGIWELIDAGSRRIFVGTFEVVADDGDCVRPGDQCGFAVAG
jgi:hypothetical protein